MMSMSVNACALDECFFLSLDLLYLLELPLLLIVQTTEVLKVAAVAEVVL